MNSAALIFLLICGISTVTVPRRWAPLPLLIGCCYMTMGQVIEIGPFNFQLFRMLLAFGVVRVLFRGERIQGGLTTVDKLVIVWGTWIFLASFFHKFTPGSGPVYALGSVYNMILPYFLFRIWCRNDRDLRIIIGTIAVLLVPVSISMWMEKISIYNPFAIFGGVLEIPMIRDGSVRASGPFAHPILAGSVGATCLPLIASIWKSSRTLAMLGISACIAMVVASASSGPLMSLILGIFALCMWWYRRLTRYCVPAMVILYILLSLIMSRPPYYLLSRIDLAGGSTGFHRAALIEGFLSHFHEWWAFGTDYTQHWVPHIAGSTPEHTDVTNAYIGYAVVAGLPALTLFLLILWNAFTYVDIEVRKSSQVTARRSFVAWCLGSALFAHATTNISVVYFDQTLVLFWATISMISSLHSITHPQLLPANPRMHYSVFRVVEESNSSRGG